MFTSAPFECVGLSVSDRVDDQADVCAIPASHVLAEEGQRGLLRLEDHDQKGKDDAGRTNGLDTAETPYLTDRRLGAVYGGKQDACFHAVGSMLNPSPL
jgi:hypothetical protein